MLNTFAWDGLLVAPAHTAFVMGTDSEDLNERSDEEDEDLRQKDRRDKMTGIDKRGKKSYDLWLRNSKMLYDYVLVHSTEWPSYVAEWYFADEFPSRSLREESYKYAILSTYSSMKVHCSSKVGGIYDEEQRMWEKDCDCIDIIRFSVPSPSTDDYRLYVDDPYRKIGTYEWKRIIHPGEISRIRYLSCSVVIRRVLPFSDWIVSRGSTNQLNIWDLKRQVNRKVKKTKNRSSTPNIMYPIVIFAHCHVDWFQATMTSSSCFLCLFMFTIQRPTALSSIRIVLALQHRVTRH